MSPKPIYRTKDISKNALLQAPRVSSLAAGVGARRGGGRAGLCAAAVCAPSDGGGGGGERWPVRGARDGIVAVRPGTLGLGLRPDRDRARAVDRAGGGAGAWRGRRAGRGTADRPGAGAAEEP